VRIVVRRFQDGDADSIRRLNHRLEAGGIRHRVYLEDLSANPDADLEIRPINDSLYVAADGHEIRGGTWLREQYFWVERTRHRIGWMKYPVAESLIDPEYSGVPASMMLQLLRRQPHLMALGMGGHETPFARLLAGIGWKASTIPFLFRVARPFRVLRGLTYLRQRWWLRTAMDLAAWTGAGWMTHRLFHATSHPMRGTQAITVTVEPSFTPWADRIWEACRSSYDALAVRDGRTLDHVYPADFPNLSRLRVARAGTEIGWCAAQVLPESPDLARYFGDLRVGMVTDALAHPTNATVVLAMGVRHLEALGVDLVITYLSHTAWTEAARRLRFLSGPSTLAFYRSPRAEELLMSGGTLSARCHLTRGDGDGPRRS
jgi:hypothetical protein